MSQIGYAIILITKGYGLSQAKQPWSRVNGSQLFKLRVFQNNLEKSIESPFYNV